MGKYGSFISVTGLLMPGIVEEQDPFEDLLPYHVRANLLYQEEDENYGDVTPKRPSRR